MSARIWSEAWRVLFALLLGAVAWIVSFGISLDLGLAESDLSVGVRMLLDLVLGLTAVSLILGRRYAPVTVGVISALCGTVSIFAAPAGLLILVSVASRRRWRKTGIVAATWVAASVVVEVTGVADFGTLPSEPGDVWLILPIMLVVLAAAIAGGLAIGNRRELLVSLRERARLAEVEHELRAERIRDHERERIAREMHDVLAHQLSIVALHAGALRDRPDLAPEESAASVAVIHDRSRRALDDLRVVLGTLREGDRAADPTGERMPQPTFADIAELVAEEPSALLDLEIADDTVVPVTLGRHAYRIVQECLTNARKHATGHPVSVRISGSPGAAMVIEAANAIVAAPEGAAGYGLLGIEERARSLGGSSEIGRGGKTHRVVVTLPWPKA